MTTSDSPFVDLIEEFPSKELGLLEVEHKDATKRKTCIFI
jgi:hypothetical protein